MPPPLARRFSALNINKNNSKRSRRKNYGVGFFEEGLASSRATSAFLSALVFLKLCLRLMEYIEDFNTWVSCPWQKTLQEVLS